MKQIEMSEKEFQNQVMDMAKDLDWMRMHTRPAMRQSGGWSTPIQGEKGWPDIVLVRGPRMILAELKSESGRLSDEQRAWGERLRHVADASGGALIYAVWRPSDLQQIAELLWEKL